MTGTERTVLLAAALAGAAVAPAAPEFELTVAAPRVLCLQFDDGRVVQPDWPAIKATMAVRTPAVSSASGMPMMDAAAAGPRVGVG